MASKCPKCRRVVEDDIICCAELEQTWKCASCGKLTTGFVVPYGRCFMCGGELALVKGYTTDDPAKTRVIEEAVRYELEMYHFYVVSKARTTNETLGAVLEEMRQKEIDHIEELENKYHVHLDNRLLYPDATEQNLLADWLFQGIDFTDDGDHVIAVYDKAIELERRTRDHFKARAQALGDGPEKEIYRELAAEEEEHVAHLETERAQFENE